MPNHLAHAQKLFLADFEQRPLALLDISAPRRSFQGKQAQPCLKY